MAGSKTPILVSGKSKSREEECETNVAVFLAMERKKKTR
jgi:hypothetical protein